jgi:hypothetical protein
MNGKGLELFVFELYKDLGYQDVKLDYRLSKSNGQENARGQIDVTYKKFFIRRYVECKQRNDKNVDFDDYSKFETTLKTFNIPTSFGEIITNTGFDEKVKLRAKETKIKLIDGTELKRLNELRNSSSNIFLTAYRIIELFDQEGFKASLDYFILKNKSIDSQLKYYEAFQDRIKP